jgi:flagellar assembly protein FliH
MSQDTLTPRRTKKFLFDAHNFDVPDDGAEPPPPMFTQEELAAAKQDSYTRGKQDGIAEAHGSFEKQTADLLAAIRDHFSILFDEEERRARAFEKESIQLAYTIFSKAFPALNERFGLEEVKTAVRNVLETVHEQPEIIVEVPPAYQNIIQKHIESLLRQDGGPRCTIRINDNLIAGQCRMAWTNGQAMRNGPHLAEQMRQQIEQVLADKANLADNSTDTSADGTPGEPS